MKVATLLGPVLLALTVAAHPLHQDSGSAIVQARNAAENEYNDFVAWRLSRRGFDKHEIDAELQKRQWPSFQLPTGVGTVAAQQQASGGAGGTGGTGFSQATGGGGPFGFGSGGVSTGGGGGWGGPGGAGGTNVAQGGGNVAAAKPPDKD